MKKILVIHGPNLALLGSREPDIYGKATLDDINESMRKVARDKNIEIEFFQSDHEGDIVSRIGSADADCIIINPAAYTHTSVAIADAIAARENPFIEVHLTNIYKREEFRHKSLVAPYVTGRISGFGLNSYLLALEAASQMLGSVK